MPGLHGEFGAQPHGHGAQTGPLHLPDAPGRVHALRLPLRVPVKSRPERLSWIEPRRRKVSPERQSDLAGFISCVKRPTEQENN